MARTADLSQALSEAEEWLGDVIGELENAEKELDDNKDSDDIEELRSANEYALSQIQIALSRLR